MRELARQAGIVPQHAQYHLRVLERLGLVHADREGGHVRYHATQDSPVGPLPALGERERSVLSFLRRPTPFRLLVLLLVDGPGPLTRLAQGAGLAPSTAHEALDALRERGLVDRDGTGPGARWSAVDPPVLRALLLAYEPPSALVEGFLDTWRRLGP